MQLHKRLFHQVRRNSTILMGPFCHLHFFQQTKFWNGNGARTHSEKVLLFSFYFLQGIRKTPISSLEVLSITDPSFFDRLSIHETSTLQTSVVFNQEQGKKDHSSFGQAPKHINLWKLKLQWSFAGNFVGRKTTWASFQLQSTLPLKIQYSSTRDPVVVTTRYKNHRQTPACMITTVRPGPELVFSSFILATRQGSTGLSRTQAQRRKNNCSIHDSNSGPQPGSWARNVFHSLWISNDFLWDVFFPLVHYIQDWKAPARSDLWSVPHKNEFQFHQSGKNSGNETAPQGIRLYDGDRNYSLNPVFFSFFVSACSK